MDLQNIHKQVLEILKEAENIALSYFRKEYEEELKADRSILTEVDTKMNEFFITRLTQIEPSFGVISEETKPESLKEYNWVIDPIDGTSNYEHGNDLWGVNIAILENDKPIYGIMYLPMLKENFMYFINGVGAFNYKNEKIIWRKEKHIKPIMGSGSRIDFDLKQKFYSIGMQNQIDIRKFGAACYETKALIDKGIDLLVFLNLAIWDVAPALGMIEELGIPVRYFSRPNDIISKDFVDYNFSLIAGDQDLIDKIADEMSDLLS